MKYFHDVVKYILPPALIGLTLVALLRESELITVGRFLDLLLDSFDRLLGGVVAPIELLFSRLIVIFKIPAPEPVWRYIFVCSIFMHLRSFQVEWRNSSLRFLALVLLSVSLLISLFGSYFIGLLGVSGNGMLPLLCVVGLMSLMEAVRNTIMGIFKLPKDRPEVTRLENMAYYHKNWTLGYTGAMLVSLPITYWFFSDLTENLATVGFFVIYFCIAVFLSLHFLVGFFILEREPTWVLYRTRFRGTIDTAFLLLKGLASAFLIMASDALIRGDLSHFL